MTRQGTSCAPGVPVASLFETGRVLGLVASIADGLEAIGRKPVADYLRTLTSLAAATALEHPERFRSRADFAAWFDASAASLEKIEIPFARPEAVGNVRPFVRAARAIAAAIRAGQHARGDAAYEGA